MVRASTLALGLAAAVPAVASAQPAPPPLAGTRLDIVAEGEVVGKPDIAEISAGVVSQATTASAAMSDNARRMTAVVAALRKAGVAANDIRTSSVNLNPQYRYADNQPPQLVGYQASNQVTIRFRDIARAGGILDVLVGEGANQIDGPNFGLDKPEVAQDAARRDAIAKARARAELYAGAAGLRVKRILAISESAGGYVRPPMPVMAMAMREAKADSTPIEPGESRTTVTVNVSFELE